MMQTSNMLDFYLKLNNNYALILQSVKMSCSMEKERVSSTSNSWQTVAWATKNPLNTV